MIVPTQASLIMSLRPTPCAEEKVSQSERTWRASVNLESTTTSY
jgi:hypothetical protein